MTGVNFNLTGVILSMIARHPQHDRRHPSRDSGHLEDDLNFS
jgi:hypothetical protein